MTLTIDRLREVLSYDRATGVLRWVKDQSPRHHTAGRAAGTVASNGYLVLSIDGKQYKAHRLAWMHVHGQWPKGPIDHRDHNKQNNALKNLRDATNSINSQNRIAPQKRNSSGYLGVWKNRNKWAAKIMYEGRATHIGTFDTPQEAHQAYVAAKRIHHPGNTL